MGFRARTAAGSLVALAAVTLPAPGEAAIRKFRLQTVHIRESEASSPAASKSVADAPPEAPFDWRSSTTGLRMHRC